ncbi:MAG: TolC family protein [Fibrobacteria bacterium]|nr:TolC family protein [Fibrobacteria bacterium]
MITIGFNKKFFTLGHRPTLTMLTLIPIFLTALLSTSHAEQISLEQAIAIGLKNNFDIKISKNTSQIAQNNKKLGVGGMLPNLTASASTNKAITDEGITVPSGDITTTTSSLQGALSWTLFDGFRMFRAYSSLQESAELSKMQSKDAVERMVVKIIQAYFNAVTQTALCSASVHQVEISKNRLKKIELKRDLGGSTETERLNAKVALNADLSVSQQLELARITAFNQLKILLGMSYTESLNIDGDIILPGPSGELDHWLSLAKKNNAALSMQQKAKRLAELNLAIQRSAYWPIIQLTGGYGISNSSTDPTPTLSSRDGTYSSASISLQATMHLFTGFKNVTNVKNTKLSLENQNLTLKQYELQLEALVYQQWETIQNAYQQVEYNLEGVELAERHLALVTDKYNMGKVNSMEYREAQISLIKAEINLASSKFQARLAQVELERLGGKIKVD